MLKLKYLNTDNVYEVYFNFVSEHIVEIVGNLPICAVGFTLSRPDYNDNWDYSDYKTIYREINGGVQFSNDGSVYEEPDIPNMPENPDYIPEPYIPTLEELQEAKVTEMNAEQQRVIQNGINIMLSDGTTEHFTLTDHDQISLMGLQKKVDAGIDQIEWHTSDQSEHCKFYSNKDMEIIAGAALEYVTYHVTYFRDLRIYIRSLSTKEDIQSIYYGMPIPVEYQSKPLRKRIAAQIS